MHVLKWKIKRVVAVLIVTILILFWIRPRKFNYKEEIKIENTHPSAVWEYVADFSNMIKLNPTMRDFSILSESGNFEHWKYSTKYTEHLSHWPYLKNIAVADFSIYSNWRNNLYVINSTHITCFIRGWFCVHSDSEFKFTLVNNINVGATPDTLCEETVNYGCPPLFYLFCRREVAYQRHTILTNLKNRFSGNIIQNK